MGQCRGGHLKTRTDPTFTTISYRLIFFSRIRAQSAEGVVADRDRTVTMAIEGDRDNLKRNGTEKRDPLRSNVARRLPNTALGNAHSRIYPSHLLLPAGWGLLALPIAIHREPSIPFSFSFLDRRRRRRRRSILLLYIRACACVYIY